MPLKFGNQKLDLTEPKDSAMIFMGKKKGCYNIFNLWRL